MINFLRGWLQIFSNLLAMVISLAIGTTRPESHHSQMQLSLILFIFGVTHSFRTFSLSVIMYLSMICCSLLFYCHKMNDITLYTEWNTHAHSGNFSSTWWKISDHVPASWPATCSRTVARCVIIQSQRLHCVWCIAQLCTCCRVYTECIETSCKKLLLCWNIKNVNRSLYMYQAVFRIVSLQNNNALLLMMISKRRIQWWWWWRWCWWWHDFDVVVDDEEEDDNMILILLLLTMMMMMMMMTMMQNRM